MGRQPFNYSKFSKLEIKILKNRWIFIIQAKIVESLNKVKKIEKDKDKSSWHPMPIMEINIKVTKDQQKAY